MTPAFTLVSTTFNEINRLDVSIREIEGQSLQPTNIIIVDAGSKDGTYEKLLAWKQSSKIPVEILSDPGCNVAEGRNLAIRMAKTELIASTDFGCRYHTDWLRSIISPFAEDATLEVVGGSFTVKEEEVINNAQKADYVLQDGYRMKIDDSFTVSSRSIAYKKNVWEQIGGYPEWLTLAADDTIFWRQIRKRNIKFKLVDTPYVYWNRHKTFKGFEKEAGRYGLGDGESGINMRTYLSHCIETSMRYSFAIHLLLIPFYIAHSFLPLLLFVLQLFGFRSYKNAFIKWVKWRSPKYNLEVLMACLRMIEVTRISYLRGYTKGLTRRDPVQKQASKKLMAEIS